MGGKRSHVFSFASCIIVFLRGDHGCCELWIPQSAGWNGWISLLPFLLGWPRKALHTKLQLSPPQMFCPALGRGHRQRAEHLPDEMKADLSQSVVGQETLTSFWE